MKTVEIIISMVTELAKLILRSEEKTEKLNEGALKFIDLHPSSFPDSESLKQRLQSENKIEELYLKICGEGYGSEEPCYSPYTPGLSKNKGATNGFLIHIFKGEQDIAPLDLDKISIGAKQYHRILHALKHDLKRLGTPPTIDTWLFLLQRYGKWIPAASHLLNVSLYHYARFKMALAAIVDEDQIADLLGQLLQPQSEANEGPLAFYAARLVGTEKFIHRYVSGLDLNSHKGSIYYLQMLREQIEAAMLQVLDLPSCNCLEQDDDSFLLLVPAEAREKLLQRQVELQKFILDHYQGTIGLAGSFCPIALTDLQGEKLAVALCRVQEDLQKQEKQLYGDLLAAKPEKYSCLVGPFADGQPQLASFCRSLEQLGEILTKTRWIAIAQCPEKELSHPADDWQTMLAYFGVKPVFLPKKPENDVYSQIYRFGNTDFACANGIGFKFSDIIPYLTIESDSEELKYWSVINLRIDSASGDAIDTSFPAYLTNKEHVEQFFRTYLAALLREKKYRKCTYLVKIANQQIVMVCSPQVALPLVNQIYRKFRHFTEDKFSLSARINVFDAEYPLNQAVFEEQRQFALQANLRNKITVMEEVLPWSFLESLLRAQEKLSTIAKLKGKRFLFPLWGISEYFSLQRKDKEQDKKDIAHWRHLINYHFNRLGITDNLEKHILEGERGPVYLNLAIHWNYLMTLEA